MFLWDFFAASLLELVADFRARFIAECGAVMVRFRFAGTRWEEIRSVLRGFI